MEPRLEFIIIHDNERCSSSCSDWAVYGIMRGRFAVHCFGTMLKVEGLEKRLGLDLARSRSRSRLVAKIRHLGLVSVSWNCRKVLVSVSSRSRKLRSRLHPCCLVTEAHRCEQVAQGCYAALPRVRLNPRPIDRKSNAIPVAPPRHLSDE